MTLHEDTNGSGETGANKLEELLRSLQRSLVVRLIMSTPMEYCEVAQSVAEVLGDCSLEGYSQFPVRQDRKTVGVLVRTPYLSDSTALVGDEMRQLCEGDIVAADMPIRMYIERAADQPFHLVLEDDQIAGIVTRSDLLKLPVRLHLFTLLSHLETAMLQFITSKFSESDWMRSLNENRRIKVKEYRKKDLEYGVDNSLIYYTQWTDKRTIIYKLAGFENKNAFKKGLKNLERLRDPVMHANNYPRDAARLLCLSKTAEYWIKRLSDMEGQK